MSGVFSSGGDLSNSKQAMHFSKRVFSQKQFFLKKKKKEKKRKENRNDKNNNFFTGTI